jgi:hypothetical protein
MRGGNAGTSESGKRNASRISSDYWNANEKVEVRRRSYLKKRRKLQQCQRIWKTK